jgi:hypothetical protein
MKGRKPIGDRAMTAAERQQRRRDRLKADLPVPGNVLAFRRELWRFVHSKLSLEFSGLDPEDVEDALEDLGHAIRMDVHMWTEGVEMDGELCREVDWVADYLAGIDYIREDAPPRDVPAPPHKDIYRRVWSEPAAES